MKQDNIIKVSEAIADEFDIHDSKLTMKLAEIALNAVSKSLIRFCAIYMAFEKEDMK